MNALELLNRGYADLISVVPPHAKLSPGSAIREEDKGKSPGIRYADGLWGGYNWRKAAPPTHAEVEQWMKAKANVGLRANLFPAIDIDCTDEKLSNVIRGLAFTYLGMAPERVGRAPKRLLVYKTTEPFRRMRLWIRTGNAKHLIEVLGDGQQFVVAGIHPVTGKPYTWPAGILDADDLEEVTRDQIDEWLTMVQDTLEIFGYECEREGSGALARERASIDQTSLQGDAAKIRDALAFLPNTNETFPGRDDYLRVGYAIKAALGEDGYPLYEAWALEWEGNDSFAGNDPDTVHADWQRMQAPFEVGAPWLYEMAQKRGYDWAADEFEADDTLEMPTAEAIDDRSFMAAFNAQVIPGDENRPKRSAAGMYAAFSDADMAERLVKRRGETIRYCETMGKWLAWDGHRWSVSGEGRVKYLVSQLCAEAMQDVYATIENPKTADAIIAALGSNAKKNAITSYAQDMPALAAEITDLDAQPHLLNTPDGVIDLRFGERLSADPKLLQSKLTKVSPAYGVPEVWMQFLRDATGGDADMIEYLQRVAGYALTGDKSLHSLHFFYGPGGNGKGTFLNTLRAVWGDYAKVANMELFTAAKFDKHPTELAGLAGSRLVQETDEGRSWDESKLKQLTSNDPVSARLMRQDFFEFIPTFKLLFAGNHRPSIKSVDDAMRRRIHIVPFTRKPATPDITLGKRLEAEYPQILQWAIEGAMKFYADGALHDPDSVHEATAEYFEEEDDFAQWLSERTAKDENARTLNAALAEDYIQWSATNGGQRRNPKQIGIMLGDRGYKRFRQGTTGARGFMGIRLTREPGDEFEYDPALA
jgi:P4 family phage/plasmid primase-like protien